jgi:hypothetical protein
MCAFLLNHDRKLRAFSRTTGAAVVALLTLGSVVMSGCAIEPSSRSDKAVCSRNETLRNAILRFDQGTSSLDASIRYPTLFVSYFGRRQRLFIKTEGIDPIVGSEVSRKEFWDGRYFYSPYPVTEKELMEVSEERPLALWEYFAAPATDCLITKESNLTLQFEVRVANAKSETEVLQGQLTESRFALVDPWVPDPLLSECQLNDRELEGPKNSLPVCDSIDRPGGPPSTLDVVDEVLHPKDRTTQHNVLVNMQVAFCSLTFGTDCLKNQLIRTAAKNQKGGNGFADIQRVANGTIENYEVKAFSQVDKVLPEASSYAVKSGGVVGDAFDRKAWLQVGGYMSGGNAYSFLAVPGGFAYWKVEPPRTNPWPVVIGAAATVLIFALPKLGCVFTGPLAPACAVVVP